MEAAGRRLLLGVVLALLVPGCGAIGFQRAWASFEPAAEGVGMEGRWKGEWRSEWNGHSGGLRCLMTRTDETSYLARFYSTYAALLYFRHETLFHVLKEEAGTLSFEGEQDLGRTIGGVYRYAGTVAEDTFRATYQAENGDHGVFEMKRVD